MPPSFFQGLLERFNPRNPSDLSKEQFPIVFLLSSPASIFTLCFAAPETGPPGESAGNQRECLQLGHQSPVPFDLLDAVAPSQGVCAPSITCINGDARMDLVTQAGKDFHTRDQRTSDRDLSPVVVAPGLTMGRNGTNKDAVLPPLKY